MMSSARICVVGVGGAGGNAINNMISSGLQGVEFYACNTDAQDLSQSLTENRIQLGPQYDPWPGRRDAATNPGPAPRRRV